MDWKYIVEQIENATRSAFQLINVRSVAGGDINSAYCLQGAEKSYFVKLNSAEKAFMFSAESAGLVELSLTHTVRVPKPIVYGEFGTQAFLVLEFVKFGVSNKKSDRNFGRQLALLHQQCQPYFGWHCDNTIGSTLQPNDRNEDWIAFWRSHRLQHQLALASANGYQGILQSKGEKLCDKLESFFEGYIPQPALLHGDLWGGNASVDKQGNPIMFDPACYYGDREADLAMTELFGGFSQDFYAAYRETYPTEKGYMTRKKLYNLYHILNHLNLFGGGYLRQAENIMGDLLSEVN